MKSPANEPALSGFFYVCNFYLRVRMNLHLIISDASFIALMNNLPSLLIGISVVIVVKFRR